MSNAKNIERNRLDYLLTDTMPVELTEFFSYSQFYDFLFSRQKEVDRLVRNMKLQKDRNQEIPFNGGEWGNWATTPLKYGIMKGINGTRVLNLVQPMAALHMYFFVSCYQKEILDQLKQNACFSLRYHSQNNNLCYRSKKKKVSSYFWKTSKKIDRAVLQQTGMFFKIRNYYSIVDFTGSRQWRTCNFRYRYFAKADYKSCFDSIYTHAFKWCITKDTVDSKNAANSNLNIAIDRILQNINGHSSNGVIIGPEFSRMIAEVLLGHIDKEVKYELEGMGLRLGKDYRIFRFVDDLFIFSNNPEDQDRILDTMGRVSQKYLLQLNESKCVKTTTPVVLSTWIGECRELAAQISELFFRKREVAENKGPLVKNRNVQITRMMEDFVDLIKAHPREEHHIVSFILSTLLNNISSKKDGYTLFDKNTIKTKPYMLLELAMYFYSFCPSFESTRKILSMLVYMNDELHFKANKKVDAEEYHHKKLVALIRRYAFIFEKGNLNDLVNWFVFFYEYQISLKSGTEKLLEEKLEREDNPLLWANYLIYSRYYDGYHKQIVERINDLLANKLDELRSNEITMQQEFWYVLVFGNCPYISAELRSEMSTIIKWLYREDPWEQMKREILPAVDLALQENISDDVKIELVKYKTLLHKPTFSEQLMGMKKSIVDKMNKARTDKNTKKKIQESCFGKLQKPKELTFSQRANNLIYEFLSQSKGNLFFNWDYDSIDLTKQMTFRTSRMTDFKPYRKKGNDEGVGSLDS